MRKLVPVLGIAAGLAALGCSGDEAPAPVAPADAGGRDAALPDAPAADAIEAGGFGASLSWQCPAGGATCAPSEVTTYNRCLLDRCEAALKLCPCEGWVECTTRCSCTDLTCRAACIPSFACLACGQAVAQCLTSSGCVRPACYEPPPDAAPPDVIRPDTISVVVGPARLDAAASDAPPDAPTPDGPRPDVRLEGTCADLQRCCDSLPAAGRATCQAQLTVLPTDPLCAAALLVYRSTSMCR